MPHKRHIDDLRPDSDPSDRRIAEASLQVGVSPRVLRYWELSGVVRPSRDPAGRRHFNRHDLLAMSLIREMVETSQTSISDLRLVRELAEREVAAAMADPLTRLKLLFQRQAAEEDFHRLIEAMGPGPGPRLPGRGRLPGGPEVDDLARPHSAPED
ncbi:MAG: helix-turn-helix domain-containing protein [Candidatus Dormibacteria bacterium]